MKAALLALVVLALTGPAMADTGDFALDRNESWQVARGEFDHVDTTVAMEYLVANAADCGLAGEAVARPVYARKARGLVLVGFRCVQDNRGNSGN